MIPPLLLIVHFAVASAAQLAWQVDKGKDIWSLDVRFEDVAGDAHTAIFSLPADAVRADLVEPFRYREQEGA